MKRKVTLLASLIVCTFAAQAEIAELRFKDMQNQLKIVTPSDQWINPATAFDVDVMSGLDRYVQVSLLNGSGTSLWSMKSSKVTVDDRMTSSTGNDYYGKRLAVPAFGEGNYTLREIITDLQNNEVSRRDYTVSVDRTPPKTGTIGYSRNGWQFGSEEIFTSLPPGMQYASVQAIVFSGLSDAQSGLDRAEYFLIDSGGVERKREAVINQVEKSVTVQNTTASDPALAPVAQADYRMGLYVYDKAGNRAVISRESTIDRISPPVIIQVLNTRTGAWENYSSGMPVFTNPISMRVLRYKSNFTAINKTNYGWADSRYQTSDSTFNIFSFNYVYPNVGDTYHEFETLAGGVRRVHHNDLSFTPAAGMEIAPRIVSKEIYRSDTGEWSGTVDKIRNGRFTQIRVNAEPRNYEQRMAAASNTGWYCLIPAGATTCTMNVDYAYTSDKGFQYIHIISGKNGSSIYDNLAGNFVVVWDTNPPIINTATVNRNVKNVSMTVTDNDRVNGWQLGYWDTRTIGVVMKNAAGTVINLPAKTWTESDFKTKNAVISYADLPDGKYTVQSAFATDLVGNTASYPLNEVLVIDSTSPEITYRYQGDDPEQKLVKGLENLRINVTDPSADASLESLVLSGGPNSEHVTLAFTSQEAGVYTPEYPRIFPVRVAEDGLYTLEAQAVDASGNRTAKKLNFMYQPANMVTLDRLKTLATAVALKTTDNQPLAFIRTSVLRRKDGSVITGKLNGTLSVRKDADFPITVADVTVAPGETKTITFDMGQGEERIYSVTPGKSGVTGASEFALEFPQL
ncbi:Ig-like domain-containing protein [Enterobacter cloacae complex sp. ECC445]|uniref:Ig-like domain-containing protein n=1 Tax=Enterobacter cloacae complex sp. ECC445 TaxID=2913213 RepID=UPI001F188A28|nr:Ig-like domain-containing protein [Enterobacter cloacae complex sp. ECC445]MCG0456554.1 Ig-like domain-containing protein [Enterobacter cloacae complex sp. ECC445]